MRRSIIRAVRAAGWTGWPAHHSFGFKCVVLMLMKILAPAGTLIGTSDFGAMTSSFRHSLVTIGTSEYMRSDSFSAHTVYSRRFSSSRDGSGTACGGSQ